MGFFDIYKPYPITQAEERAADNEAFYRRAEVLKARLDAAAAEFVKTRCKCKPYYTTPIPVFLTAWRGYCETAGVAEDLKEYYDDARPYYRLFGNVSFGEGVSQFPRALPLNFRVFLKNDPFPEGLNEPQFYTGITLI